MLKRITHSFILTVLAFPPQAMAATEKISIESYRQLAQQNDEHYAGARLHKAGATDANLSEDAITDTQVFFQYRDIKDEKPTLSPSMQGTRTETNGYTVGLQKQTAWGPSLQIAHNTYHTIISDSQLPAPNFYDSFPSLEATIPLWRNLLGGETRAELKKSQALGEIRRLDADIQMIQADAKIDMAFYDHQADQEHVNTHLELLDRANKIHSFVKGQLRRGLADSTDLYQAEAAVKAREIELELAKKKAKDSAREFNKRRGIDSDVVSEELVSSDLNLNLLKPSAGSPKNRKDLTIAHQEKIMKQMEFRSGREHAKPKLDLVVRAENHARDLNDNTTLADQSDKPYYSVGVNFSMPLDVPKYIKIRRGLVDMREGQNLIVKSHEKDLQNSWHEFVSLGEQLYRQVQLLRDLEKTQKLKADAERIRLNSGRTTTFQLLTFEQEYISARKQRIDIELQARHFITQLPLFD